MIGVAPPAYDPAAPTTANTLPVGSPATVRAYVPGSPPALVPGPLRRNGGGPTRRRSRERGAGLGARPPRRDDGSDRMDNGPDRWNGGRGRWNDGPGRLRARSRIRTDSCRTSQVGASVSRLRRPRPAVPSPLPLRGPEPGWNAGERHPH
ncbi:hypothetical protein SAURM35S_05238 [Streptomyces aurantiogriseus]